MSDGLLVAVTMSAIEIHTQIRWKKRVLQITERTYNVLLRIWMELAEGRGKAASSTTESHSASSGVTLRNKTENVGSRARAASTSIRRRSPTYTVTSRRKTGSAGSRERAASSSIAILIQPKWRPRQPLLLKPCSLGLQLPSRIKDSLCLRLLRRTKDSA